MVSVESWLTTWLDGKVQVRESTPRSYTQLSRNHLIPHLGRIPLRELGTKQITTMLKGIRLFSQAAGRPVSDGTIARIHATLRASLNAALREGLLDHNSARDVQLSPAHRPQAVVWTEDRINQWLLDGQRPPVAVWTATQTAKFLTSIRDHQHYAA